MQKEIYREMHLCVKSIGAQLKKKIHGKWIGKPADECEDSKTQENIRYFVEPTKAKMKFSFSESKVTNLSSLPRSG